MSKYCSRVDGKGNSSRYLATVPRPYNIGIDVSYRFFVRIYSCRGYRQRCGVEVGRKTCSSCRIYRPRVRCYRQSIVVKYAERAGRRRQADCIGCCACVDARYWTRLNCNRCRCHTTECISYSHTIATFWQIAYSLRCPCRIPRCCRICVPSVIV